MKIKYKYILLTLFIFSTLPIIPQSNVTPTDPTNVNDHRVLAKITNQDLNVIISTVRAPKWFGLYLKLSGHEKAMPVLAIAPKSGNSNILTVVTGNPNNHGKNYIFENKSNKWVLVETRAYFI